MSFITKFGLEYLLRDKKSLDDIRELCAIKSGLCNSHKNTVCKKSLEVSGYKVPNGTESCLIFKELLNLAKGIERPDKINIIKPDTKLIDSVNLYGSDSLREFFIKNGYDIKMRVPSISKQILNTQTLPNSNNFANTIISPRK